MPHKLARCPRTIGGMQTLGGKPVFSATDLVGFLACGHLTELERCSLAELVKLSVLLDS